MAGRRPGTLSNGNGGRSLDVEAASEAPPIVAQALRSPGHPLDASARAFFEPRFGYDLSRVRIHTDAEASQSARSVAAKAYTVGNHIAFETGRFAPSTREGGSLLAHELAHVVQQGGSAAQTGRGEVIQRAPANYPGCALPSPQPRGREESKPNFTVDDVIGFLDHFRHTSPQEFVKGLIRNEALFYPILQRYGFKGSWVDDQKYLADFDTAVQRWGKGRLYAAKYAQTPAKLVAPKLSPKEQRYRSAIILEDDFFHHGYRRDRVRNELEASDLMDVAKAYGFDPEDDPFYESGMGYQERARLALIHFIGAYERNRGGPRPRPASPDPDIEICKTSVEGLDYFASSFLAATVGGATQALGGGLHQVVGAAGAAAAVGGIASAVGTAFENAGNYSPRPVGRGADLAAINQARYSGEPATKPTADPQGTRPAPVPGAASTRQRVDTALPRTAEGPPARQSEGGKLLNFTDPSFWSETQPTGDNPAAGLEVGKDRPVSDIGAARKPSLEPTPNPPPPAGGAAALLAPSQPKNDNATPLELRKTGTTGAGDIVASGESKPKAPQKGGQRGLADPQRMGPGLATRATPRIRGISPSGALELLDRRLADMQKRGIQPADLLYNSKEWEEFQKDYRSAPERALADLEGRLDRCTAWAELVARSSAELELESEQPSVPKEPLNLEEYRDAVELAQERMRTAPKVPRPKTAGNAGDVSTPSGYKPTRNDPHADEATDRAMQEGREAGYEPEPHEFDRSANAGESGRVRGSHAEKKAAELAPNEPVGVSKPMCSDCIRWFRHIAVERGIPQVVADPAFTRIFMIDGAVYRVLNPVSPSAAGYRGGTN
ncbi:MAG TPA: DUF4157 domain-containing protein [Bryobacteraceae bacterium]